jgi:integrase/recombinase XerD
VNTALSTHTAAIPASDPEERLIDQWVHGRSSHTKRAYRVAVRDFRAFCSVPLDQVTVGDLQAWADEIASSGLAPASQALRLTAVKSLRPSSGCVRDYRWRKSRGATTTPTTTA